MKQEERRRKEKNPDKGRKGRGTQNTSGKGGKPTVQRTSQKQDKMKNPAPGLNTRVNLGKTEPSELQQGEKHRCGVPNNSRWETDGRTKSTLGRDRGIEW